MNGGDPIERLLQATGKRPPAPEARRERVRAAVHDAWTTEIAAGARRRRLHRLVWLSAAGLAAVVAISVLVWPWSSVKPSGLTVSRAIGDAWVERGPWILRDADALRDGVTVAEAATVTLDTHAKVALRDAAGRSIRLDGGCSLFVIAGNRLRLDRGAVYVDTGEGGARGALTIDTPFGTIEEVGTQYQARLEADRLVIRVREGKVALRGQTRPANAAAGQVIVADGNKVAVADDPGAAEGWDWVEAVAPLMAIDGRSLEEFVRWAARERGARIRWADPSLEAKAGSIALHGSIEGMTVETATESVLATAGVSYRWAGDEMVIGEVP